MRLSKSAVYNGIFVAIENIMSMIEFTFAVSFYILDRKSVLKMFLTLDYFDLHK